MGKYEEALERARAGKPIDEVFPELKMSEDERIRNGIIHFILYEAGNILDEETEHAFITWLEKQKEPLTPEEKMNHPLYLEGFDMGRQVGEVVAHPAEWSEEDKETIEKTICILETNFKPNEGFTGLDINRSQLVDRLNSLRPQPKQKWSEEDSRILYNVISYVGYAAGQRGVRDDEFKEANSWLKSLKNRGTPQKSNTNSPSWKPSKVQMEALAWYSGNSGIPPTGDKAIKSLYNDLQKLL